MRIVYKAVVKLDSDETENHIRRALMELGHEVVTRGDGDIYLFHKEYNPPADFTGKKVCWYFDKIWADRINWFYETYPKTDFMFMTDGTWVKNNIKQFPNLRVLRQGIGDYRKGEYEDRHADVAFVGNPYGERQELTKRLWEAFGGRFKVYERQFNRKLNNLCASIPIFVAPIYPSDDNYWSNRVYLLVGSGAFLIHPRLKGLEEEWGDNLVYYDNYEDLIKKIVFYRDHPIEREAMREKEYNYCVKNFTYKLRVEELLKCLNQELAK